MIKKNNISKAKGKGNKECSYCSYNNHIISECRLKQKHDRERQNKRARFESQNDLNSQQGRHNSSATSLNPDRRPENAFCLASKQPNVGQTPQ